MDSGSCWNDGAFSLVELSIVLVILGLLTGGILAGQSLIRAGELRAVTTEYQRYITATHSFRDKYFALPGDMADATRFWGRQQSADCVTNSGAAVVAGGVCDGAQDGQVIMAPAVSVPGESHQFWRQLAAAGLIEGSYTGIAGSGGGIHVVIGINGPASRLGRGGWGMRWVGPIAGNTYYFDGFYGNFLGFGAEHGSDTPAMPVMRPEEAWNIDTKLDDGKPARGKMRVRIGGARICAVKADGTAAESSDLDSTYNLSNTTIQCSLSFPAAF